jgi:hypothetical protein
MLVAVTLDFGILFFIFILLIFVTLLGLKVRGGSAGVVESFYGVIKPIPIV